MQKVIVDLWKNETLPVKDAVYFSSGESFSLKITSYPLPNIQRNGWFDLHYFYENNKEEVTDIDVFKVVELSNGNYCCVGEGSYGSEGFIAYLDSNKDLVWVIYSESSNPFINAIEDYSGNIVVESSAKIKLKININDPVSLELVNK